MLTRAKHKQGEGTLYTFNPEIGHASRRKKMDEEDKCDEQDKNFHMVFYRMLVMVKKMYGDYEKRMAKKGKKNDTACARRHICSQDLLFPWPKEH